MEEKERYELISYCSYRDTETGVIRDNFVGLLNQQDQKIKDLEDKLAESKKQCQECKHLNKKIELNIKNKLMNEIDQLEQQLVDMTKKYELASLPMGGLVDTARNLEKQLAEKDKQIADLQHRLRVAEITTKLACDYLNAVEGDKLYELCKDIYNDNDYLIAKMNYFKEQAEKEVKGEN